MMNNRRHLMENLSKETSIQWVDAFFPALNVSSFPSPDRLCHGVALSRP